MQHADRQPSRLVPTRRAAARLAALVVGLLSGAGTLPACGRGEARSAEVAAAVAVRTSPVERGPVARPVRAAGTVSAKDHRDLSFKVGGLLADVAVREGEAVRRGQVLARLDATELAAGARQAREARDKARRDLDRVRLLVAGQAIARASADDAETGAAVAEAALQAAEFNLARAVLVAPDDGWVDRRLAEPGEVVAPGRPVLQVSGRARGFVVRANLPDRDVLGLAPGDPAVVTLDARPGETIPARVTEISRAPSRGTGTYPVEVRLDPARVPRDLLNGLTAKVEIQRDLHDARSVPLTALVDGNGAKGAIFVADGEVARRVPVEIAFLHGGQVVVAGGLEGIDRVVTDGASRLVDGARVRLVP